MFKKSILVSLLGMTSILPTTAQTVSGDTLAASKIASKALKLINSGKESKISKGIHSTYTSSNFFMDSFFTLSAMAI